MDILREEDAAPQKLISGRKGKRNNNGVCEGDNVDLAQFVNEHHL